MSARSSTRRALRVLIACFALVLAVSAVSAAHASAIEFNWKVAGAKLAAGKEKALTSKAKGNQVLKGSVIGVKVEITCTEVATPGAKIIGGVPGTTTQTVEYKGCTVQKPAGCTIKAGTITTNPLLGEIVEGVGASAGNGLLLFKPKEGETFAEPKLEGGIACLSVAVKGTVLAEPLPQKIEAETGTLKFEPTEHKKYKNSKGEEKAAGLTTAGSAATVTGEVETKLNPLEKFGVF